MNMPKNYTDADFPLEPFNAPKEKRTDHRITMASAWFHFSGHLRMKLCEAAGASRWAACNEWSELTRETQIAILKAWDEEVGQ